MSRNILVTDFDNSGENVILFNTEFTPEEIKTMLEASSITVGDVCEVKNEETQYYVYEPLFANPEWDKRVKELHKHILKLINE